MKKYVTPEMDITNFMDGEDNELRIYAETNSSPNTTGSTIKGTTISDDGDVVPETTTIAP
jgi:hypothetical protein